MAISESNRYILTGRNCQQCLSMLTDGDLYLPNGSWGIQCCQPSKSWKNWWKNQKNGTKIIWQHRFRLKQLMTYPIPWLTSVMSATIHSIGYHRLAIGKHCWHWWGTWCIFGNRWQSWHWLPDPNLLITLYRIIFGCHQSPNVPWLNNNQSKT